MAAYPGFAIDQKGSEQVEIDDLAVDVWPNGSARGRSYITPGKFRWKLLHGLLPEADRLTLEAFYVTNRLLYDISFVSPWDSVTYNNVMFTVRPNAQKRAGAFWDVTVELRQVI